MGLTHECREYVGRVVYVEPHYGYGWVTNSDVAEGREPLAADIPPPFHLRILKFFTSGRDRLVQEDLLGGGIGLIVEPTHAYDGLLASFSTRHEGVWDFKRRPGVYNILIGAREVIYANGWINAVDGPQLSGYAQIREGAA